MGSILSLLSGSTNGKGVLVTATSTNTQTIHTADATDNDIVALYATSTVAATKLTLELGGLAAAIAHTEYTVPLDSGLELVLPPTLFADGVAIKAFAATGSQVTLFGYVERAESTSVYKSYARDHISGSTSGIPVKVAAITTPGTTIHTAHATAMDSLWLFASNTDSSDRTLTIEWGAATLGNTWTETLPAEGGPIEICTGLPISNSLVVKALASAADVVNVWGYYIRST